MAIEIFRFQYEENAIYGHFVDSLGINPDSVNSPERIPFLPISAFKTQKVQTGNFTPVRIFESSGTTGENSSRHYIKDLDIYCQSFLQTFELFYGRPKNWCIAALLPGYLERENSSLVYMVTELIKRSGTTRSGFYLNDHEALYKSLVHNEMIEQPTLLFGVTFALLDFAEKYKMNLKHTTIIETGGMKGKREEIIREHLHNILAKAFGVAAIHSEYGMTELLSQAYSTSEGIFQCPPWMKVFIREMNDPLTVYDRPGDKKTRTGLINVIDVANLFSCSFIATDDVGVLHEDGFEVIGRSDLSDTRGCSLLTT